jgi:two-component system response regulator ChvI
MVIYDAHAATPVALVDDDPLYCEAMAGALDDRLFDVHCFQDGPALLAALETGLDVRLVLLDWTLPGMTGLAVLDELRRRGVASPVVFLTGASPVEHELVALQHGAIDFVDKARGIDVLAPRLRRLIAAEPVSPEPQSHGHLVLHPATARAEWRGRDLGFTLSEYKIVAILAAAADKGVSYRRVYDAIHYEGFVSGWGDNGFQVNVRGMMKRIRRKFWKIDPAFDEIRSIANVGYRWGSCESGDDAGFPDDTADR